MIVEIQVIGGEQVIGMFSALGREIEDLSPVFETLANPVFGDIRQRFDDEGPGWAPLAPSTIKRKGNTRILRDKDDLYGSFQKGATGNVTRITPTAADFGTADSKAMFHQMGTSKMPKRTIIEVTGDQEARYGKIATNVLTERVRQIGFEVT